MPYNICSSSIVTCQEDITWLLPGRGARVSYNSTEEAREALEGAADVLGVVPNFLADPWLFDPK